MSVTNKIKQFLGFESVEEKLQRFEEIKKSFEESDLQLDELAKDFFIEKSMYKSRMAEPENFTLQSKIQDKFDIFIKGHKESIRKAKKQFDSLKKEKDEIEKSLSNHKYIRKEPDGKGGWNYVYEEEKGKEVKAEMKPWIKERARKITNGYKNPFTGDISNEDEEYAHFVTFATKVSEANKYDSFDELLSNTLKKSLDNNIQSKQQTAYSKIKKAYQHGKISLDSFNTIIKGLTKDEKTKYSDFLLFNENGELLLLKRSSWEDDNAGAWVIPGGHVDPGEDFKTAAIRELQEESGYNVEDAENVGSYEDDKCHIEYFQAYIDTKEKSVLLQFAEVRDYKWIPVNEICEEVMVFNMRDNVLKILGIEDQDKHKKIIRKAILKGIIPIEMVIAKSKDIKESSFYQNNQDKYKQKLERLEARRTDKQYTKEEADYIDNFVDGDHQEENSCDRCGYYRPKQEDDCLKVIGGVSHNGHCKFWEHSSIEKGQPHKYLDKKLNSEGKFDYIYSESKNKESNNYEKIKDYAKRITEGREQIKRLSPEEEQGRIRSGRANVEGVILIGTNAAASDGSKEAYERRPIQERLLEEYAKASGLWIDRLPEFNSKNFIDSGAEAKVYKYGNNKVIKINNLSQHEEPVEFLDRIAIHNFLFPDTYYEVVGFMRNEDGDFCTVVKQPFIEGKGGVDRQDVVKEMEKMGFTHEGGNSYRSNDYLIDDLHKGNILNTKYGYAFIDPIIYLNKKEDGYDGNRELGSIELPDTLQKAYLLGLIPDDFIEKAWKKQPIGTVTTRKDGQQYRKVTETGDMDKDWKVVSKDKAEPGKPESEGSSEAKQVKGGDKPINSKELEIHAKNASESTLQAAIKESADEQVRISAHNELDRREKEEKPQEEKDGAKSEEKKDLSKEDAIKIDDHLGLKFLRKEFHEDTLKDPNFKREQEILNSLASELGLDNALEVYDAVKRYSSSTYGRMNNSLRENKLPKNTDLIDTFIDVAPKNSSSTLFRGIGADFGKTLTEGKVFSDPAFVSTTENKSVADNFAKKNKSGYTLEITGAQNLGTNMPENWRSARKEGEQEVLLPRNLQFKVDSIDGKKIKVSIVNEKEKEEKPIKKAEENELKGGKADKETIKSLAEKHNVEVDQIKDQLKLGISVEMEHSDNPQEALEIAMDHIFESAEYYTKLKEMESKMKEDKSTQSKT